MQSRRGRRFNGAAGTASNKIRSRSTLVGRRRPGVTLVGFDRKTPGQPNGVGQKTRGRGGLVERTLSVEQQEAGLR